MKIGLLLGLVNEKFNQTISINKEEKQDDVVHGDAKMLMNM